MFKVDSLRVDEGGLLTTSDGVINEINTNVFEPKKNLENGIELNSNQTQFDSSSISINDGNSISFL